MLQLFLSHGVLYQLCPSCSNFYTHLVLQLALLRISLLLIFYAHDGVLCVYFISRIHNDIEKLARCNTVIFVFSPQAGLPT